MRLQTFSYVGTGVAGRTISGIGFSPQYLEIKGGANVAVFRTSTMPTDSAKPATGGAVLAAGVVTSLTADGFVVGSDVRVNATGTTYFGIAVTADDTPDFAVLSYTGDGTDNRDIGTSVTVPFRPGMVQLMGEGARNVVWRPNVLTGDATLLIPNLAVSSNTIQALNANGFQVGSGSNGNFSGEAFHAVCFGESAVYSTSYVGDGTDDRAITGVGFQADYVRIKSSAATVATARHAGMVGDLSADFDSATPGADRIQSIDPDGVTVGTSSRVNTGGATPPTYYLMALVAGQTGSGGGVPTAPTGLTATPSGATDIVLNWTDNASDETGYRAERATAAAGPWTEFATPAANATTVTDTGRTGGVTYWYRVRAVNGTGFSTYSNTASATAGAASANALTLGSLVLGSTYNSITIDQFYTGDDNGNSASPEGVVTTTAQASAGATSLTVTALPFLLVSGTRLTFLETANKAVRVATLSAQASAGATSLTVTALAAGVASGAFAHVTGVQFKRQADSFWRFAPALHRVDKMVSGAEIADGLGRAFHGKLHLLESATAYDLRLTLTDADGISGTHPVVTSFTTRADTIPAADALAATHYVDSVSGSDLTGTGATGTPWRTLARAINRYNAGDAPADWRVMLRGGAGRYYRRGPDILGGAGRSLVIFGENAPVAADVGATGTLTNTTSRIIVEPGLPYEETAASGVPLAYVTAPTGATNADVPAAMIAPWSATTVAGLDTAGASTGRTYSVYKWTGCPINPFYLGVSATRQGFPVKVPYWEKTTGGTLNTNTVGQWAESMFWESRTLDTGHLYGFWCDATANITATATAAAGATTVAVSALPVSLPSGTTLRFASGSSFAYATLTATAAAAATSLTVSALAAQVTSGWSAATRTVYCRIYDPANEASAQTITHAGLNPNTLYCRFSDSDGRGVFVNGPNIRISRLCVFGNEIGVWFRAGAVDCVLDRCMITGGWRNVRLMCTSPNTYGDHITIQDNYLFDTRNYEFPRHSGHIGWNAIKQGRLGRAQTSNIHFSGGHKWVVVRRNYLTDCFDHIGLNPTALSSTTSGYSRYASYGLDCHDNTMIRYGDDAMDQGKQACNTSYYNNYVSDGPVFFSTGPTHVGPVFIFRNKIWRLTNRGTGRAPNGFAEVNNAKKYKYSKSSDPPARVYDVHNTYWCDEAPGSIFNGAVVQGLNSAGGGNQAERYWVKNNLGRGTYYVWDIVQAAGVVQEDHNLLVTTDVTSNSGGLKLSYTGGGGVYTDPALYRTASGQGDRTNKPAGTDIAFSGSTAVAAVDAMLTNPTAGDLTLVSGAAARHAGTPLPNFSDVPYPGSGPVLLYHYDVAPDLGYAELLAAGGDTTAPTFSDVAAGTPTSSGVTITWTTNEASDSQVEYGLTASYGSFSALLDTGTMVTSHSVPLSGLTPNTLYHYRVRSRDAAGNLGTDTTDRTFTTAVAADTTGPVISNVSGGVPTSNGTIVTWTTNEPADSQVEYGTTTAYGDSTPIDNGLVTSHSVPVSGLLPSTLYHYRVRSTDAVGNPSVSGDFTFTTAAVGVPVAPSGLTAVAVGQTQITLSWSDQSVDETGFEIEWSPNGSTGWTLLTAVGPNVQTYNDTGLAPGTTRFYRLRAYRVT